MYFANAMLAKVPNQGFAGTVDDLHTSALLGVTRCHCRKSLVEVPAYVGIAPTERAMRRQSSA
jgi:hypothetical protein